MSVNLPFLSQWSLHALLGLVLLSISLEHSLAQDGWSFGAADSPIRGALRPSVELGFWSQEADSTGWMILPDDQFFQPRLSLATDLAFGDHLFFSSLVRIDRGFYLGDRPDGDLRLDEITLRWRPGQDERFNLQIGKFATVFGQWVSQHDFYDDPFLLPPLAYNQVIGIQHRTPAAMAPAAIEARSQGLAPRVSQLDKRNWASPIWGPVYATGASVFGAIEQFDFAFELKSSGLSSHPDQWEDEAGQFDAPTIAGRLGWRPDAAWAFGISAARGAYLAESAETLLPAGIERDDLVQTTLGFDARWAAGDWIISGEVIRSEYETLSDARLRTIAWHLGARYKAAPGLWLAARIGALTANDTAGVTEDSIEWTPEAWRTELALGWRMTEQVLLKLHYTYTESDDPTYGNHLMGCALGWRW